MGANSPVVISHRKANEQYFTARLEDAHKVET